MFDDYYAKYLNIDKGILLNDCLVCKTELRDKPLNKRFIYRIIITDYNGYRVISTSPSISDGIISNICNDIKNLTLDSIINSRSLSNTGLRISKMYRMILDNRTHDSNTSCIDRESEYINDNKKYVIRDHGNIISYCKISDIDFNFGNMVVWTDENNRRKGLARDLLLKAISRCKAEDIEPIYLVDCNNNASIELAKSVGFRVIQNEIIACEVNNYGNKMQRHWDIKHF